MTEQQLQKKILDYIKSIGGYARKVSNANRNGTPDIIACIEGKFYAFECKVERNIPTQLQIYNIDQIRKAGGVAQVVYSLGAVKEVLINEASKRGETEKILKFLG